MNDDILFHGKDKISWKGVNYMKFYNPENDQVVVVTPYGLIKGVNCSVFIETTSETEAINLLEGWGYVQTNQPITFTI